MLHRVSHGKYRNQIYLYYVKLSSDMLFVTDRLIIKTKKPAISLEFGDVVKTDWRIEKKCMHLSS
jgi:hypothetical protein